MDVAEKLCMKNPREREAEVADFEQQTRDLDHHLDLHMRLTRQRTQRKCLRVLLFERENFRLEGFLAGLRLYVESDQNTPRLSLAQEAMIGF